MLWRRPTLPASLPPTRPKSFISLPSRRRAASATFAIGNEMGSLTGSQYRAYWTDIISAVRQVYHGEITYAAATDEASKVSFWDLVDTIGVNTYPPLTSSQTPTVQDLIHAWTEVPTNPYYAAAFEYKSPVDFLHSLSEQYGKPVLMTELGYRSVDGTAISPGSWSSSGTADANAQADAYNAFFQVWSAQGGSWLKGVELWQWDLNNQYNSTGYSVMGKPAEAIVSQYFHGDGTVPGLTIHGSAVADVIDVGSGNNVIYAGLGNDVIRVGNGNNTIITPTTTKLTTTTITLTGWGSEVNGVGAQAQILVNGEAVSGVFEFKPATDPSGYQTYTVTFDNASMGSINSVDINLVNATPQRALHVKDFSINGVALSPSDATNASSPGTFDLYVHTIHFDTTNHQDWFVGASTDNDVIYGGAGNDVIYLGVGNDTIDGGGGINTAVFQGNLGDYNISYVGNHIVVSDKVANRGGVDYSDKHRNPEVRRYHHQHRRCCVTTVRGSRRRMVPDRDGRRRRKPYERNSLADRRFARRLSLRNHRQGLRIRARCHHRQRRYHPGRTLLCRRQSCLHADDQQ